MSEKRYVAPPRPLVLEAEPAGRVQEGQTLNLDVVLIGSAIHERLPQLVAAWHAAGRRGLDVGMRRLSAELREVLLQHSGTPECWTGIWHSASGLAQFEPEPIPIPEPPLRVRVEFLSPIRLKHRGRILQPKTFSFAVFVARLTERLRLLERFYGFGERDCPAGDMASVGLVELDRQLDWLDYQYAPSHRKTLIKIGGLVGQIDVEGSALPTAWPALWLGQWTHAGSAISLGFGQYRVTPLPV